MPARFVQLLVLRTNGGGEKLCALDERGHVFVYESEEGWSRLPNDGKREPAAKPGAQ